MVNSWINTVEYHNFDGIHSWKSPRVFDMNLISNQMKSQHYLMFELGRSYFRSEEFESEIANSKFSIGESKLSGSLAKVCFFSLQVQHSDEPIASKWVTNDQCISMNMAFTIPKRENVQISTPESIIVWANVSHVHSSEWLYFSYSFDYLALTSSQGFE